MKVILNFQLLNNLYMVLVELYCPAANNSPWSRSLSERRFNELFKVYYIIIGNFDKFIWGSFWINTTVDFAMYSCLERCCQIWGRFQVGWKNEFCHTWSNWTDWVKGQIISETIFLDLRSPKKQTFFKGFLP